MPIYERDQSLREVTMEVGPKRHAAPSAKIKKLEEKLRKKFEKDAGKINPEALESEIARIGKRFEMLSDVRVKLDKEITAPIHSPFVKKLWNQLQINMVTGGVEGGKYPLKGRIAQDRG